MTARVLFLGFHHRPGDPRLFHRQMRAIRSYRSDAELFFMTRHSLHELPCWPGTDVPMPHVAEPQHQYAQTIDHEAPKRLQWLRRLRGLSSAFRHIATVRKL